MLLLNTINIFPLEMKWQAMEIWKPFFLYRPHLVKKQHCIQLLIHLYLVSFQFRSYLLPRITWFFTALKGYIIWYFTELLLQNHLTVFKILDISIFKQFFILHLFSIILFLATVSASNSMNSLNESSSMSLSKLEALQGDSFKILMFIY